MTDHAQESLPEVVYTPASPIEHPTRMIAAMWRDLLASRELAWRLFTRDFRAQYRQSVLGYFWAFVPPVLAALPWMFLNSQKIVNISPTGIPYPAFVMTGTMLWQTFIDALNSPLKQTAAARSMLAKINFPKEALLLAGVAEVSCNLIIRLLLLFPVLWVLDVPFHGHLAWLPLGVACLILLGMSIGLLLTPAGMLYSDVGRGISVIASFGMLLTPVVYPPPTSGVGGWLAAWNPVSPVLATTRDWMTGRDPRSPYFSVGQVRQADGLRQRLLNRSIPASELLWNRFSEETRTNLAATPANDDKAETAAKLVAALNQALASGPLIDPDRLDQLGVSPNIRAKLADSPNATQRMNLDRRWIEESFGADLAPSKGQRFWTSFWWVSGGSLAAFLVAWLLYRLAIPILVERMGG
ncbi:MAG: ABC transporter permease [Verrucomicrobiales bacterium]|nr:ABC transporter permease [Verrucomicrobiales bacterium]